MDKAEQKPSPVKYAAGDTVRILAPLESRGMNEGDIGRLAQVTGWWASNNDVLLTLDIDGVYPATVFGGWVAPVHQVEMVLPVARPEPPQPTPPRLEQIVTAAWDGQERRRSRPTGDLEGEIARLQQRLREVSRTVEAQTNTLDTIVQLVKARLAQ